MFFISLYYGGKVFDSFSIIVVLSFIIGAAIGYIRGGNVDAIFSLIRGEEEDVGDFALPILAAFVLTLIANPQYIGTLLIIAAIALALYYFGAQFISPILAVIVVIVFIVICGILLADLLAAIIVSVIGYYVGAKYLRKEKE